MKLKFAFILLCLSILSGCGYYRTITGTVIDAETQKPIQGAVVMVEWTKTKGFGLTYTESFKVIEAVTDANGKVSIEGLFNAFVDPPVLVVYKPGYVAWSSRAFFASHKGRDNFKWGDLTFQLERFRPEYSYVEHGMFFDNAIHSTIGTKKIITGIFEDWEREKRIAERNMKDQSGAHR